MPSICFVNSDNYPVLDPKYGSHYIGGESVQQTLLAKEFVQRGWRVSMVCEDFGQPDGVTVDDVTVWKTFAANEGLPILRFFYPRLYRIRKALAKADADVYYQSCAGAMTGFVAAFCRSPKRKMVFRIAHDTDCKPGEQLVRFYRDRKLYEYGLQRADFVAAQSDVQKALLEKNYGRETAVIDMAVEIPEDCDRGVKDIDVLWVNNIRDFKRPDIVRELAKSLPQVKFVMIGGPVAGHDSLHREICRAVEDAPNLDYLGAVPYHEVNRYFERAKLFVNTSDSEGFPNSFLQAWVRRIPVVSFFDPDSVIQVHELGASPQSFEEMQAELLRLLDSPVERDIIGERARKFVIERFSPRAVVDEYLTRIGVMNDVASGMVRTRI